MVDVSDVDIPKYDTNAFDVFTADIVAVLDVTPFKSIVPRWIEAMSDDLNSTAVHSILRPDPAPPDAYLSAVIVVASVNAILPLAFDDVVLPRSCPPKNNAV